MPRSPRIEVLIVLGVGLLLTLGSVAELLALAFEGSLGRSGSVLEVLHADPRVRAWVLVQNLVTLGVGVTFVRGAVHLRRGHDPPRLRGAAIVLLITVLCGQLVLALTVYPAVLRDPPGGQPAAFWIASMGGAAAGLAAFALGLLYCLGRRSPRGLTPERCRRSA
jgi:hypothetical protein